MPVLFGYLLGIAVGWLFGHVSGNDDPTGWATELYTVKYQAIFGCIGAIVGYIVDLNNDKTPKSLRNPWVYIPVMVITGILLGQKLGAYYLIYQLEVLAEKGGILGVWWWMIKEAFLSRHEEYTNAGAFYGGLVAFAISTGRVFYGRISSPEAIKPEDSVS